MDFGCGGGSFEQHVVEASSDTLSTATGTRAKLAPKVSGMDPLCGCVKDSNYDDEEPLLEDSVPPEFSLVVGASDDDDEDDGEEEDATNKSVTDFSEKKLNLETPEKRALDTIQQQLDEIVFEDGSAAEIGIGNTTPCRPSRNTNLTSLDTPVSQTMQQASFAATPSPSLLNPLNTEWKETEHLSIKHFSGARTILCPTLDISTSTSLASLLQRMEEGFRVKLTGGPISCLADEDEVLLYLHPDHSRLCVESATSKQITTEDEKKQQEIVDFWIELPVSDILRLESNKSPTSFSIVLEKEPNCLVYYDFDTSSAIDREVLVSTIIIVLDQTHNSQRNIEWTEGGTMDQPIPCSPSLEQGLIGFVPSIEHPAALSPGAHPQLSPSKRTQIYNSADRETETSLVIHLEDLVSTDQSEYWGYPRHEIQTTREPTTFLPQKSSLSNADIIVVDDVDDIPLDFKPSASSTHLATVGSSSQLAAAWCGGNDICTLALRDIADTCSGIFAIKQAVGDKTPICNAVGSDQLLLIEEFIAAALGAPASVYSCIAGGGDIWNIETSSSIQQQNAYNDAGKVQKDPNNSFVRNRATLLNAQAARLRKLRNEMTFAAALKQSRERMQFVQTVRSFDDAYYSRKGKNQKLRVTTEAADRFHSSPLLKSVVGSMSVHDPNGNNSEPVMEEVAYYDSDPEDSRPRVTHSKAPRRAVAEKANESVSNIAWREQALSGIGFEDLGSTKKLSRKLDEDVIVEMVHAMTNERFTLLWHPTQNMEDTNLKPICAKIWIEAGVYLSDGTFLLPKLTWCKATTYDKPQDSLEKLDLLDVCRICPTQKVNRQQHPFAVTHKSFFIETQRDMFVFQAQSTEERDRIMFGLKLVVARLASLLMLRDIRAAEEFFGSIANMVPGEAPAWARGKAYEEDAVSNASRTVHL